MPRKKKSVPPTEKRFKAGDKVTIFSIALFRRPQIEGRATIIGPSPTLPDCFRVRFAGERKIRERLVFGGDWQADPEAMLRKLLAQWRTTLTPEILAEFFPDDVEPKA